MENQMIFKRYEIKYKISVEEKRLVLAAIAPYMRLDKYGRTTIRNLYFDTNSYRLIRRSLERPVYKEKLRLRSYEQVSTDQKVFLELKKKYESVVYKRRAYISEKDALQAFAEGTSLRIPTQIGREINYFKDYYQDLTPKVFLSYEREAYYALDGSDFRITFDENILYRQDNLSLSVAAYGTPVMERGYSLMEIKTAGAIPLWLTKILTELKIFKSSFSKYGRAYQDIVEQRKEALQYARVI